MYAVQGFLLRSAIVLAMVAAVVTILYLTPMPDQRFLSCDRPCHEYDWPMICRIKIIIENERSTFNWCEAMNCTSTGQQKIYVPKNRHELSSSIQVCQNDVLVVDVINRIPGQSVTVHWRGQTQNESPIMDGVPMVTQCPISSYTTFQYKFKASSAGTHLWHAFSGSEIDSGIFGALIVRKPQKFDSSKKFYDVDDRNHVVLISETKSDSVRKLEINGDTKDSFNVTTGKRYRFRLAYMGGASACPVEVDVEDHLLKIIGLDGNSVTPYEASSIILAQGERVDFVLKANKASGVYRLRASPAPGCTASHLLEEGRAIVAYEARKSPEGENRVKSDHVARKFDTAFCERKVGWVCVADVRSREKMPAILATDAVDRKLYLGLKSKRLRELGGDQSQPGKKVYAANNVSFTYPSSPLLTQRQDVDNSKICGSSSREVQGCVGNNAEICECVHVEKISLASTVELILIDQGVDEQESVFHLHGHKFYVVGHKMFNRMPDIEQIKQDDQKNSFLKRNFASPVLKDTIRVPKFGTVVLRFIANNPGYWMLRDGKSDSWSRGLDVVFQVGDGCEMVSKPSDFPTCGSWIGPEFFLI